MFGGIPPQPPPPRLLVTQKGPSGRSGRCRTAIICGGASSVEGASALGSVTPSPIALRRGEGWRSAWPKRMCVSCSALLCCPSPFLARLNQVGAHLGGPLLTRRKERRGQTDWEALMTTSPGEDRLLSAGMTGNNRAPPLAAAAAIALAAGHHC